MIKLLRANLTRMAKNKYFWFCVLTTLFINATIFYIMLRNGALTSAENTIFTFPGISVFTSGAFAALFLGEEYSDHTIRNKLIIGATRTQICFANTITTVIGGFCMIAAEKIIPLLTALFGGAGKLTMSAEDFTLGIVIYVCAVMASCALFAMIGTNVTKRSASVALTLALTIISYIGAPAIKNKLDVPQMMTVEVLGEDHVTVLEKYEEPNPDGVTGAPRVLLESLYNTLSFGQLSQAPRQTDARPYLPLYSLGTAVAAAGAGALIFRKKDLK